MPKNESLPENELDISTVVNETLLIINTQIHDFLNKVDMLEEKSKNVVMNNYEEVEKQIAFLRDEASRVHKTYIEELQSIVSD